MSKERAKPEKEADKEETHEKRRKKLEKQKNAVISEAEESECQCDIGMMVSEVEQEGSRVGKNMDASQHGRCIVAHLLVAMLHKQLHHP